jgi:peptidoglycan hydrolase-like protein with peptidoglycan-binding domain
VTLALAASGVGAGAALAHDTPPSPAPTAAAAAAQPRSAATGIAAVQRALGISADGVHGPKTRAAIRRFQRRNGLKVDGIAGAQTRAALGLAPTATAGGQGSPPATPRAVTPGPGATATAGAGATLARIAACESGGDPTAVSPDGRYRGKYQFTRETWARLGGTGDPARAGEDEQDRLATQLLAQEGTAPWPTCAG